MIRNALIQLNKTQVFLLRESQDGSRAASWRVWVLIFLLPALFLMAAGLFTFESYQFVSKAERTTGEVVHVYAWDGWNLWDGDVTDYSPVFRYQFSSNEITEASTGQSSPNWNYDIGSKQEILFDPSYKGDVKQDDFEQLWAVPVIIGLMGLLMLLPALLGSFFVFRWLKNAPINAKL